MKAAGAAMKKGERICIEPSFGQRHLTRVAHDTTTPSRAHDGRSSPSPIAISHRHLPSPSPIAISQASSRSPSSSRSRRGSSTAARATSSSRRRSSRARASALTRGQASRCARAVRSTEICSEGRACPGGCQEGVRSWRISYGRLHPVLHSGSMLVYVVCETPPTTYTQLTYTPSAGYN
jgi:hypothetical protein